MYEVNAENFSELVIEQSVQLPVLVDFWASWCAPCQMLMPILNKLENDFRGQFALAKVNTEEQIELAQKFQIQNLPTLKLFVNKQIVEEIFGVQPEQTLRALLDKYIERESDKQFQLAQQLISNEKWDEARKLLESAFRNDPRHFSIWLELVHIYFKRGNKQSALHFLQQTNSDLFTESERDTMQAVNKLLQDLPDDESPASMQIKINDPQHNNESRYHLALALAMDRQYVEALDILLDLLSDATLKHTARQSMLNLFRLMDASHPDLVSRYRAKMFTYLH